MVNIKSEIESEFALINYFNDKRELSYDRLIHWVGKRYSDLMIFQKVMEESTSIDAAITMLSEELNYVELSQSLMLSKISESYQKHEISILDAVAASYDLLNSEGDGTHELSRTLYKLVDDYSTESRGEYEIRVNKSDAAFILNKYNTGEYEELHDRVFSKT